MDTEKLEQLYTLKQKGVISEAEFQAQKKLLLSANEGFGVGEKVSMGQAYKSYWQHSFKWKGRATRAEYWWPQLANFLIAVGLSFVAGFVPVLALLYFVFCVAIIFPGLSVMVRRYHDLGHSAWFAFVPQFLVLALGVVAIGHLGIAYLQQGQEVVALKNTMVVFYTIGAFALAIVGVVWGIVFPCLRGQNKANKYGDPR